MEVWGNRHTHTHTHNGVGSWNPNHLPSHFSPVFRIEMMLDRANFPKLGAEAGRGDQALHQEKREDPLVESVEGIQRTRQS